MTGRSYRSWAGEYAAVDTIVADIRAGYGVEDVAVRHPGLTLDRVRMVVGALRDGGRLVPGFFAPLAAEPRP